MRKHLLLIIISLIAYALFITCAHAYDGFTYHGKVVDAEGNPIQAAHVQVYDLNMVQTPDETGVHVKTVRTERDGSYTVALHCSDFRFVYSKDGYITESRVVETVFVSDINLGTQTLQRTIDLYIPVPSRTAYQGERLDISLQLTNSGQQAETVTLNATSALPWRLTIRDATGQVAEVTLNPGTAIDLNLTVDVPLEASGTTQISVNAQSHVYLTRTLSIIVQDERPRLVECLYPSRVGTQGDTVDFKLTIHNPFADASEVTLSTEVLPDDWDASWVNLDDEKITSVILQGDGRVEVTLRVEVPQTASEAVYTFKAYAETQGQRSNASLSIKVERRVLALGLNTRYPVQSVEMGESLSYRLKLTNPGGTDETISLSGKTLHEGWRVSFTNDAGAYIQSVLLEAWGEEYVTAVVEPAADAEPGRYEVRVEAASQRLRGDLVLTVGLVGSTEMELQINNLYARLTVGEPQTITMGVKNTGYSPLNLVGLETGFSENLFKVECEPLRVMTLEPGNTQVFELKITALEGTAQGDYMLDIRAISREIESAPLQLRLTVMANRGQLIIVGSVVVAAFASIAVVYKKFKRR
jgi:uncharacterized membrane protein